MEKKKEKITGNRIALIILMSIYTLAMFIFPKNIIIHGSSILPKVLVLYLPIIYNIAILISLIFNKRSILKFVMLYPIINCLITIISNIEYINFTAIISQLIQIAPYLFLAFISFNKNKKKSQKIWFLPGVIYIVRFILSFFFNIFSGYEMIGIFGDFINILWIPIMFLLGYYLSNKKKEIKNVNVNVTYPVFEENYGYMDMASHVLLLIFTFGIWYLVWIYKATTFAYKSNRESGSQVVLCMFVPFYSIYWTYLISKMLDDEGKTKGIYSEISILCVILQLFAPIAVPIIMQNKMNTLITSKPIYQRKKESIKQEEPIKPEEPKHESKSKAAEIKEYKELLDMGAITQEEYDKKKKELLK